MKPTAAELVATIERALAFARDTANASGARCAVVNVAGPSQQPDYAIRQAVITFSAYVGIFLSAISCEVSSQDQTTAPRR